MIGQTLKTLHFEVVVIATKCGFLVVVLEKCVDFHKLVIPRGGCHHYRYKDICTYITLGVKHMPI